MYINYYITLNCLLIRTRVCLHANGKARLIISRVPRMIDERGRFAIVDVALSRYDVSLGAVLVTAWPIAYRAHIRKSASKKRISRRVCARFARDIHRFICSPASKIALRDTWYLFPVPPYLHSLPTHATRYGIHFFPFCIAGKIL